MRFIYKFSFYIWIKVYTVLWFNWLLSAAAVVLFVSLTSIQSSFGKEACLYTYKHTHPFECDQNQSLLRK